MDTLTQLKPNNIMAHLIIPQPDGKFALYSTVSDSFVDKDLTKEELIYSEIRLAIAIAVDTTKNILDRAFNKLETKGPNMTYEEALANHNKNTQ